MSYTADDDNDFGLDETTALSNLKGETMPTPIWKDVRKKKLQQFTMSREEAVTVYFALNVAIADCESEMRKPTQPHGPAESAVFLVDLKPLHATIKKWLDDNPRPGLRPKLKGATQ